MGCGPQHLFTGNECGIICCLDTDTQHTIPNRPEGLSLSGMDLVNTQQRLTRQQRLRIRSGADGSARGICNTVHHGRRPRGHDSAQDSRIFRLALRHAAAAHRHSEGHTYGAVPQGAITAVGLLLF